MSGVVSGRWCKPTNTSADEKGGIHDDDTAQDLGFQGGTIAGSIHMEQFAPLLLELFGVDWWRTGGMSLYFKAATMDLEPVCCKAEPISDVKARIWMENEDGGLVMEGTASLGEDETSELRTRIGALRPAADIRMLQDVVVGRLSPERTVNIPESSVDERLAVITEDLPVYHDAPEFGGRVLPVAPFVHAFRVIEPDIAPIRGPYVGLFGAIEVQYLHGPVVAGRDYTARGKVLALSDSPKTEILWYEATLTDAETGVDAARMIKMDRLMKGASPLWSASS